VKVYEKLRQKSLTPAPKVLLAHSRFTQDHRRLVENALQRYFGKQSSQEPAILVTTQVAEAGLNISASLVITELCPMDSLIQRAGRCQRFRPEPAQEMKKGKVFVVKPAGEKWHVPYTDRIRLVKEERNFSKGLQTIELTRVVLETQGVQILLNWKQEQELIDKSLNRIYEAYLLGSADIEFQKGEEPFQSLYNVYKPSKKEVEEGEEFPELEGEE